jgi:hypothetical protein
MQTHTCTLIHPQRSCSGEEGRYPAFLVYSHITLEDSTTSHTPPPFLAGPPSCPAGGSFLSQTVLERARWVADQRGSWTPACSCESTRQGPAGQDLRGSREVGRELSPCAGCVPCVQRAFLCRGL